MHQIDKFLLFFVYKKRLFFKIDKKKHLESKRHKNEKYKKKNFVAMFFLFSSNVKA